MKGLAIVTMTLLMFIEPVLAGQVSQTATRSCLVEVLHSEELPIGPMFFHTIKATLLVTAPGMQPFEATVQEVIPWQAPPRRQGKRLHARCDATALNSSLKLF
jgi:hypothetical protein